MARLNDPPVTAIDSLDALKRRFIRQNREIARVNSTQSQRIRNLENEISRLLAENIALRERAIAAAAETDRLRRSSRLGSDVVQLKSRLEAKLGEVNALVEELGGLPERAARKSGFRRRKSGFVQDVVGSPTDRNGRGRETISGIIPGEREAQEGRLPAILEDKYYPRRTLETEELRILTAAAQVEDDDGDTESPDLGPPPIAHFEVADSIAFDSTKSPKRVSGGIVTGDDDATSLAKNLETRRKRRTSSLLHEMSNLEDEVAEDKQAGDAQPEATYKSNIKRKFEGSEAEVDAGQLSRNDGFEYQRREPSMTTRRIPSRFTPRPADRVPQPDVSADAVSPRRALAPKSTNSPAKRATAIPQKKSETPNYDNVVPLQPAGRRAAAPKALSIRGMEPAQLEEMEVGPSDGHHAPKTPAPALEDMISPPSSAIDTAPKPKPKSTEVAISNSVEDVLSGSIGRGSRRAKAAVSYAEPNLRDKMRRPDKKLVGAVEGLNKLGTASDKESSRERGVEPSNNSDGTRMALIRSETKSGEGIDRGWKDLPENETREEAASPLQERQKSMIAVSSETRKKRTHSESEGTRTQRSRPTAGTQDELDKAVSRLSIFDPPNSSPVSSSNDNKQDQLERDRAPSTATAVRSNRSVPNNPPTATARARRFSVQPTSDPAPTATTTQNADKGLTRSSSTMSMRDTGGKENINNLAATSKLKRASSAQTMNGGGGGVETRTVGTRRRSMMV